jgi:hypothetical protein
MRTIILTHGENKSTFGTEGPDLILGGSSNDWLHPWQLAVLLGAMPVINQK